MDFWHFHLVLNVTLTKPFYLLPLFDTLISLYSCCKSLKSNLREQSYQSRWLGEIERLLRVHRLFNKCFSPRSLFGYWLISLVTGSGRSINITVAKKWFSKNISKIRVFWKVIYDANSKNIHRSTWFLSQMGNALSQVNGDLD